MPIQFVTDQYKDGSVTASKAKLDQAWVWSGVAPQSTVDATASNDLVRYSQIQGLLNGVHWKESVKVATTGNISLTGTQTIDSIAVGSGDRVLVRAQNLPHENGIYVAAGGGWARSADMDAGSEFPGAALLVQSGATHGDTGFICTNDSAPNLGVTAIAFTSFFNSAVADGSITNQKIANGAAISFSKLEALNNSKILVGNGSNVATGVTLSGHATLSNTGQLTLAAACVNDSKIAANAAISLNKLAAVTSANFIVGNASNVAAGVAMSGDCTLANTGAVTIANGAINNAKISNSAGIAFSKLQSVTSADFVVGNASNQMAGVPMSGDCTLANTGAVTISAGAINNAKISNSAAIAFSKLEGCTSGNILIGSAGNAVSQQPLSGDATLANTGALTIGNNAITSGKIADNAVTLQKVEALNSAQLIIGDAGNRPQKRAISGDISISNSGVTTIQNDSVSLQKVSWAPKFQTQTGNGSTAAYDLADDIESSHYNGVLVFRNGQVIKKVASGESDLSQYRVDRNNSTNKTRVTLGANLPSGEELTIWYIA